ncbi:SDR family NAD(P)-dependent oxidoreductase [Burkholderia sp. BE17]|uniref:SDR family NAD(P)-dependent oxidoreductase n=1 Tax=Burkholderia sp. BE17 TaxID=2656644 RepID=UPI001D11098A|nr:SDR family NAD(P)-dependent oxidoreductase [Burkholderia sp. BE17]
MKLSNKVALVTGAGSGIGRGTALRLAAEGASVVVADVQRASAEETAALLREQGGRASVEVFDVGDDAGWAAAIARSEQAFGAIHIVCNIAGITSPVDFEELSLEKWNRELAVNLTGVFLGCQHGVRAIRRSAQAGAIVNLGSVSGLRGVPSTVGYSACKGGVRALTQSVAMHCAQKGYPIRCNTVLPSYVDTSMFDAAVPLFGDRETMLKAFAQDIPLGRVATPDDIARAVVFLASDDSAMVTGTELIVDGGHTARLPTHF